MELVKPIIVSLKVVPTVTTGVAMKDVNKSFDIIEADKKKARDVLLGIRLLLKDR